MKALLALGLLSLAAPAHAAPDTDQLLTVPADQISNGWYQDRDTRAWLLADGISDGLAPPPCAKTLAALRIAGAAPDRTIERTREISRAARTRFPPHAAPALRCAAPAARAVRTPSSARRSGASPSIASSGSARQRVTSAASFPRRPSADVISRCTQTWVHLKNDDREPRGHPSRPRVDPGDWRSVSEIDAVVRDPSPANIATLAKAAAKSPRSAVRTNRPRRAVGSAALR